MLIEKRSRDGIVDGSITLLFRRWRRSQAVAGHRYRTPAGRIAVDTVDVVKPERITERDARRAGFPSAAELRADLRGDDSHPVFRLRVHYVDEPDPRSVLAATDDLSDDNIAELDRRLERLDKASSHGAWTMAVLETIEERPAVRAPDLAASFGRETAPFKIDVRKLKNLGLTLSLAVGYRLSPRGVAYLRAVRAR